MSAPDVAPVRAEGGGRALRRRRRFRYEQGQHGLGKRALEGVEDELPADRRRALGRVPRGASSARGT